MAHIIKKNSRSLTDIGQIKEIEFKFGTQKGLNEKAFLEFVIGEHILRIERKEFRKIIMLAAASNPWYNKK